MFGTLDDVDKQWVSMGEHRMNVRIWRNLDPSAPTVVLVHGALVSSLYMLPLANQLSRDYNVYVPELPGQGASPRSSSELSTHARGQLLAALLERFDLSDVVLVASSYGSQVSAEALGVDDARVRCVVFVGPTVDDSAARPVSQVLRMLVGLPFEAWWFTPLAAFDLVRFGVLRSIGMARELASHDMAGAVSRIRVPALVVRGERDYLCPESWAARLANLMGTASVTIAKAGHTTHTRAPAEVADEVRNFANACSHSTALASTGTVAAR